MASDPIMDGASVDPQKENSPPQKADGEAGPREVSAAAQFDLRAADILSSSTDGVVTLDHEWRFASLNAQAERMLARPRAELVGRSVWEAFPDTIGTVSDREYHRAVEERVTVAFEQFYPPLSAWFDVRACPSEGGLSVFFQDITERAERKRAEHRLQRLFDSQVVGVIFWNLDTGLITAANDCFLSIVGYTREDLAAGLLDFRRMTPPEWEGRNEQGLTTIRVEGSAPTYEKEYFRKDGSRVPILIGGTRFEEPGCEGFSYVLDISERKRQEEQERARLEDIFMQAPAFMATLRGPQHVFEMVNPPYYQLVGHRDILGKPVAVAIPEVVAQGFIDILDRVYQTGEPFIGKGVRLLLQVTPNGPLEERFVDFAYQPLYDEDRKVSGILAHGIDLTERKRLEIEQERLLGEAQARAEREVLLNRIGQALRASPDPERVLETVVRELGKALGADRCYYAAYDQSVDTATLGPDWRREGLPTIVGHYPMSIFAVNLDPIYKAGHTQVVGDTRGDAATLRLGLTALVRVPLVSGTTMTALSVAMADGPRDWSEDEVSLVEAVATQTQTALEAVRVARREHAIAEQLQDALQPRLPDHVPGLSIGKFTQAALDEAAVGGDFFDVFSLDKELYALVIGDVSGKGLAAAQQLALIRNSLRTTLYLYRAPAQAASTLNSIVTAHDLLVGFVTAFVSVYDAATGEIVYCSCGHEPGLIRRADGTVEALETTGPPLGAAETAAYGEKSITLSPGDALLLYTDGISEAGPTRRELLGTEGLMRLFGGISTDSDVQTQVEALVAEVISYGHGVFHDDVAVLLTRRQ